MLISSAALTLEITLAVGELSSPTVGRFHASTCLWIISAIVTALSVFAVGDEATAQNVMGAYGFTSTGNCLVALNGFKPSLQPIDGQVFGFSFSLEGISDVQRQWDRNSQGYGRQHHRQNPARGLARRRSP
jgi:hypothetical protein